MFKIGATHKFEIDGTMILLDVNSGSVYVIDEAAWAVHEAFIKYGDLGQAVASLGNAFPPQVLEEAAAELGELINQGMLFSADEYQYSYNPNVHPILKSLCLHVSHDCNLNCAYCFASTGHFGGNRALMSVEVGKRAIDFLMDKSGARRHCEIDFFGGEPLMNFSTVKELVAYGKSQGIKHGKEIKFTLTTNAVALTPEVTDFLNKENISVVLSLDGRPEVNDRVRSFPTGRGSFNVINHKIKDFIKSRNNENYYVRGTYTGYNQDFSKDVEFLVQEGYTLLSVEPVVAASGQDYALREEDLPGLKEEYRKLARFYRERIKIGQPFNFFHFNLDLSQGPCLPKRLTGCGAGHEYLAVTPEGDLYPCHQFVGRIEYKLGSLDSPDLNEGLTKHFQQAHIYNKEKCRTCWARFYCSGGCHANADAFHQDIYRPYDLGCELEKARLECAIWLKVLELAG